MYLRVFTTALLFGAVAAPAGAQAVKLQFNAGQVSLSAQNAPIRAILQEWARLGGATIVNGDRVAGPPVTLELTGVPERQALDVVLRSVAGYIVAPRRAGSPGASAFDRIMILPTSVAPRAPAPAPAAAARAPVMRPGVVVPQPPDPNDNVIETEFEAGDPLEDPSQLIQGRDPRVVRPPFVMRPPGADPAEIDPGIDQAEKEEAAPAGVTTTPTNPFGVPAGSSARPGVISPAPTPTPQQRQQQELQQQFQQQLQQRNRATNRVQ
jgi:hypothetical protein